VAAPSFVTVAILAGFSSVILVMLLGQSRVFYSMSRDGLVPPSSRGASEVPHAVEVEPDLLRVTALFGAFLPDDIVAR
jgi:APA family basic amino acid/polyamine antiporter